jgi:hypothetical protein
LTGGSVRRGIIFGSVAFLLSFLFVPMVARFGDLMEGVNTPASPTETAMLWGIIGIITLVGFYLGYKGWGRYKDY